MLMTRRIRLPFKVKRPILACGADLKGAFAMARGNEAVLVDGFGDLADLDNFTRYEKAVKAELKKMRIKPGIVACDLHPGYFSTRFAETLHPIPCTLYPVQHHEAHVASAIVDNAIKGRVIGVAFDGTGFGHDGNIWGGEFFVGDLRKLRRAAHLDYIAMPGGDKAVLQPWRMGASYLYNIKNRRSPFKKQKLVETMISANINSPLTSSMGRLFDAVGSLVFAREDIVKEAELPMELERIVIPSEDKYGFSLKKRPDGTIIDASKIIEGVMKDLSKRSGKGSISAKFHNTISDIIVTVCAELSKRFNIKKVVLTGGVFQNRYLSERAAGLLKRKGFTVYRHSGVPANDSGIPIGQIAIAEARAGCA